MLQLVPTHNYLQTYTNLPTYKLPVFTYLIPATYLLQFVPTYTYLQTYTKHTQLQAPNFYLPNTCYLPGATCTAYTYLLITSSSVARYLQSTINSF